MWPWVCFEPLPSRLLAILATTAEEALQQDRVSRPAVMPLEAPHCPLVLELALMVAVLVVLVLGLELVLVLVLVLVARQEELWLWVVAPL